MLFCPFGFEIPRRGLTLSDTSYLTSLRIHLPDGVMVAQLILVQFVLVRIQVGQPFHENNLMESVENSPSDIFFCRPITRKSVGGLYFLWIRDAFHEFSLLCFLLMAVSWSLSRLFRHRFDKLVLPRKPRLFIRGTHA